MTTNIISFQVASMGNQLQQQSPSRPNNLVSSLQQPVSPAQLGQAQTVMMQQPSPNIVATTIHQPQFSTQVWSLMHLYSVGFLLKSVKESLICPEGKSMIYKYLLRILFSLIPSSNFLDLVLGP